MKMIDMNACSIDTMFDDNPIIGVPKIVRSVSSVNKESTVIVDYFKPSTDTDIPSKLFAYVSDYELKKKLITAKLSRRAKKRSAVPKHSPTPIRRANTVRSKTCTITSSVMHDVRLVSSLSKPQLNKLGVRIKRSK
jgi:hypothetical protein